MDVLTSQNLTDDVHKMLGRAQNLYSNRHVSKSFNNNNNNNIFSTVFVVAGRGSCNKNNIYEYFISSVFKYAESAEAPED